MKEALSCACMAKNATVTRDGFTPNQRVYGSECAWPSLADEEPGLSFVEALDSNTEAARAHMMRMIARVALIRSDVRDKMSCIKNPVILSYVFGDPWSIIRCTAAPNSGFQLF